MFDIIPSFITAFIISFFAIPSIIKIAIAKNLYDEPDERRSHKEQTPSLGGIGIFAGLIFSITYWTLNPKNINFSPLGQVLSHPRDFKEKK